MIKDDHNTEKEALELLNKHENVIGFYKYFEDHDSYNIILEYCPSGSLEKVMERFETPPIELITYYTA